ncbi:hypothetical protein ASJ81_21095 [Methanosarcina spelaei]|uniref:Uncharacterized protein n=1 Tax=Methanosarcina spelaei TaxID=1036679 RepID=A0A2A2HR73_9EURY|nr:hypothetical protein ASJ81_21095 [Methanosarcina spelaei]
MGRGERCHRPLAKCAVSSSLPVPALGDWGGKNDSLPVKRDRKIILCSLGRIGYFKKGKIFRNVDFHRGSQIRF